MAFLATSGIPSDNTGAAQDFAFDPATLILYGPKTTTWVGTALMLRGATGPALLSGLGPPGSQYGTPGQTYLDAQAGNLWGPKTAAGWGSAPTLNIVGNANMVPQLRYCYGAPTATNPAIQNDGDSVIDLQQSMLYPNRQNGVWPVQPISMIGPPGPRGAPGNDGATGPTGVSRCLCYAGTFWLTSAAANTAYQFQQVVQSGSTVGQTPATVPMPRAGSITGYAMNQVGPVTGTFTITIQKNGTNFLTFSNIGSGVKPFSGTTPAGTYLFAAGDYLNMYITTTGTGNMQAEGYIEIQTN